MAPSDSWFLDIASPAYNSRCASIRATIDGLGWPHGLGDKADLPCLCTRNLDAELCSKNLPAVWRVLGEELSDLM